MCEVANESLVSRIVGEQGFWLTESGQLRKTSPSGRITNHSIQCIQPNIKPDWEVFCREYVTLYPIPFKIVQGNDIHEVFRDHRPNSCMRHNSCQEMRKLYENNPKVVKVLYCKKGDHELLCSSLSTLLWFTDDSVYLDRIYSNGYLWNTAASPDIPLSIRAFLRIHYPNKTIGSVWNYPGIFDSDSLTVELTHEVRLPLPYCDSVRYIVDYDDYCVVLSTNDVGNKCKSCDSTDGTYVDGPCGQTCYHCNERIDDDDAYSEGEYLYCEACYSELFTTCEYSDEVYSSEEVTLAKVFLRGRVRELWISNDFLDSDFSDCIGESCDYVHEDFRIETVSGEYVSPKDLENEWLMLVSGLACHLDDCVCVDGDWVYNCGDLETEENKNE